MLKTSTSPATNKLSNKLLGLEGLRFLATFSVLIWHYQHFAYVGDRPVDLIRSDLPFYRLLFPFYEVGNYGVWIFWCISGFIFFWKYREAISDRSIDGWTFFVFRLSRLYPLHFATLLLVALLQPIYFSLNDTFFVYQNNDVPHFLAQLLMASDWVLVRGDSFNGPIWSVSVEVLVYAVFFLTLRFATKSPLFNVIVVIVCANVPLQVCSCLAFFYAGGLAAIARQGRSPRAIEIAAWCAAVTIPIAIGALSTRITIVAWLFLLTYTPILLFCLSCEVPLSRPLQRLLETAGNMTYSCYLLHFPIQLAIATVCSLLLRPVPFHDPLFCAAYLLSTLLAAHLVYRYFEAPAQGMIRSRLLRSYLPHTSSAISTASLSFAHCSSLERMLPSSVEAKPHCGDNASCSSGANFAASSSRRLMWSFFSSSPNLEVMTPTTTTLLPLGRKRSGSKPPARSESYSRK
jgi:peptidoglycan/LPS O-acetylase OafA/YrhL